MTDVSMIIASLDSKYIASMELFFTKEVDSNIQLEIITDCCYFEKFFLTPHKIDCLIIDEYLYESIQEKQNIRNVFVLCEEATDDVQKADNVEYVYKYSSVKEIFHKVIGKLGIHINAGKKQGSKSVKTEAIMVYSPIGGSGKTTIALGIAKQLSDLNKRVLFLNLQSLQDYQCYIDNHEYCDSGFERILYRKDSNIVKEMQRNICNVGFDCLKSLNGSMLAYGLNDEHCIFLVNKIIESKMYDYVLIDTSSDLCSMNIRLMGICDKIVLVAQQGFSNEFKLNQMIKCIDYSENKFVILCNKYSDYKPALTLSYNIVEYVYDLNNSEISYKDICSNNMLKITTLVLL